MNKKQLESCFWGKYIYIYNSCKRYRGTFSLDESTKFLVVIYAFKQKSGLAWNDRHLPIIALGVSKRYLSLQAQTLKLYFIIIFLLTWPVHRPTTRSAMNVSSVSPLRWLTITPQPLDCASLQLNIKNTVKQGTIKSLFLYWVQETDSVLGLYFWFACLYAEKTEKSGPSCVNWNLDRFLDILWGILANLRHCFEFEFCFYWIVSFIVPCIILKGNCTSASRPGRNLLHL